MYKHARELGDSFVLESLKKNGPLESLVDVGSWDGELTTRYAKACGAKNVYGLEIMEEMNSKATKKGIQCFPIRADKDKWPFDNESIDCITSNQLIEHLCDVDHFFSEASRVLKIGGILITSTNNLSNWQNIIALIFGLAPFDLTNSSNLTRGLGNPFSIHKKESSEGITMLHKCIYTPRWLFEWQKLYHLKKVSHFGAGFYPFPAILGNIFKGHAAFMVITTKKYANRHVT